MRILPASGENTSEEKVSFFQNGYNDGLSNNQGSMERSFFVLTYYSFFGGSEQDQSNLSQYESGIDAGNAKYYEKIAESFSASVSATNPETDRTNPLNISLPPSL